MKAISGEVIDNREPKKPGELPQQKRSGPMAFVFLFLVLSALGARQCSAQQVQAKTAQTQTQIQPAQMQPTQYQSAPAFTPTLVQPTNAPAATNAAATNAPQPTATIPTIAPTSTPDVGLEITRVSIKATDQALSNQARRVKLELDAIEDSQWKSRLFYTGLFIMFVGCVFLGAFAFGNASVKSWKDARKSREASTTPLRDTTRANAGPIEPEVANDTPICPLKPEQLYDWIAEYRGIKSLKWAQWEQSKFREKYGQVRVKNFLQWLDSMGYTKNDQNPTIGRIWTDDGKAWVVDLIAIQEQE